MRVAMVRVGVDTGAGGIHGPLFRDGSFEYIPIPDGLGVDRRTYGTLLGRRGDPLAGYFPPRLREKMRHQPAHVDPEFATFTYGDPTPPKAGLRRLERGDMLVFYCGLQGWDCDAPPALYLMGYFDVLAAGYARDFPGDNLHALCGGNFHVRHPAVYRQQREKLVLVKGSPRSRLLHRAVLLSALGRDRNGRPLKVLSPAMQQIFGGFDGKLSFQRSPTRWVAPAFIPSAVEYMRSLD